MKIGFISLGCPKNLVDGEVMLGIAQQAGHEITPAADEADVLVVNTCAFIDKAKQESIDAILEMAGKKRDGRCTRLVVTGCLAERYREELKKEIPEIDAVLGTGEVPQILSAIEPRPEARGPKPEHAIEPRSEARGARPGHWGNAVPLTFHRKTRSGSSETRTPDLGCRTSDLGPRHRPTYLYDADTPRLHTTPRHFAYVKIAEGCDYTCAFCIIPTLRGEYRSRTPNSIVREARALAERGVKELLLISQDTTFYGIDRGDRGALARLLRELNAVDGIEWIRLLYLYPTTITRRRARRDGRVREGLPLHRPAAAARVGGRAEADAASRQSQNLRQAARTDPRARSGRHTENYLHRGIPGRDRGRSSPSSRGSCERYPLRPSSACSRIRTRKARGRSRRKTTCRRRRSGSGASDS